MTAGYLIKGFSGGFRTDLTAIDTTSPLPPDAVSFAYGAHTWVAACNLGISPVPSALYVSRDAVTWTPVPSPFTSARVVVWTGTRFIALGANADNTVLIATSDDGGTWTARATPVDGVTTITDIDGALVYATTLDTLAGSGDTWVASGEPFTPYDPPFPVANVADVYTTDGGLTWSNCTMPTHPISFGDEHGTQLVGAWQMAHGPGGWVAISDEISGRYLLHSADGATWTVIGTPNTATCTADGIDDPVVISEAIVHYFPVAARDDGWLLVADTATEALFLTSTDAVTWSTPAPGFAFLHLDCVNGVYFGQIQHDAGDPITDDTLYVATTGGGSRADWATLRAGDYLTASGNPLVGYGVFQTPPQRQFPRDDGLGVSTRRSWPPNISQQYGLRRGTINTYQ